MGLPGTGASSSRVFEVLDGDTAATLGSGRLPVLATPRLLAWFEQVAVLVVDDAARTSVGSHVEVRHLAPTAVGARVTVRVQVQQADGREVVLFARANDADGRVVATATMTRVVVDADRFMARLSGG